MILVPPRHYCLVANPVCRDGQGEVLVDSQQQVPECPPTPIHSNNSKLGLGTVRGLASFMRICVGIWNVLW